MDVTVQIVECFSVFSLFVCFYFSFFIAGGFGFAPKRVIFVSLCNIHFSISVTFYLDRELCSSVVFSCGFVKAGSICLRCCENPLR